MVKKSLLFLCFSLICLFSLLCSFGVGVTYADTVLVPTYSFVGSNVGFVYPGVSSYTGAHSFSLLTMNDSLWSTGGINVKNSFETNLVANTGVVNLDWSILYNNKYYYLASAFTSYAGDKLYYNKFTDSTYTYNPTSGSDFSYNLSTLLFPKLGNVYLKDVLKSYDVFYNCVINSVFRGTGASNSSNPSSGSTGVTSDSTIVYLCCQVGDVSSDTLYNSYVDSFRTLDVVSITLGSSVDLVNATFLNFNKGNFDLDFTDVNARFNYCCYHLSNGSKIWVVYGLQYYDSSMTTYYDSYLWSKRTYYLTDTSDSYNTGFNDGFSSGYDSGYSVGSHDGYTDGYSAGEIYGKNVGFNQGVASANDYSFFSLISAVIDAPITAFKGLFNFDFLGFNMLNFVTGLITFCFVIWIVRLIL